MKNFLEKIKEWQAKKTTGNISYAKDGIHPLRDWGILLSVAICVMILLGLSAFYFYNEISQGKLFSAPTSTAPSGVNINNDLMQKTLSTIDARTASSTNLSQNKITVPDPSL